MSDPKAKPARAASARPANLRPSSSKNRKLHQKTQFIDNVYGSSNPNNVSSTNHHSFQKNKLFTNRVGTGQFLLDDVSRLVPKPDQMNKQKQQLFEENLHLKKQINKMKDQMIKNRAKMEMLTSKNSKYTKQFNREFEKKMYWTGNNAYLISGIKAQYEKLKQQLLEKESECEVLKRQLIESRAPEFKVYAEALQEQNKKLSQRIQKMAQVSEHVLFDHSGDKTIPEYLYNELESKLEKADERLKQSQSEVRSLKQQNKDLQKKIQFLEKLLIQKDNSQYHANKKAKKSEKQKTALEEKIKQVQALKQDTSKNYEVKLQKLRTMEQKRFRAQKDIFDRTIQEKDHRIQKLQKQVAYLSTLLTYWKPLDELKQNQEKRFNNEVRFEETRKEPQKKKKADQIIEPQKKNAEPERIRRTTQFDQKGGDFILKNSTELTNNLKQSNKGQPLPKVRVQQTADKKHNENAQKKRKVDHKEVEHLGEHLRYRFLGLRLGIDEVRKYFDYHKQPANPESNFILDQKEKVQQKIEQSSDNAWDKEYISMRQAKQTLKQSPFELGDEDAHQLARYLIEDSQNDFVYVDPNNQLKRSIVKSIIKAFVGDYEILEGERQLKVEKECQDMLGKYQSNLLSALSTMASSGYITRRKFIELLNSLGIELSEQGKDFLVCKMLLKSSSLDKLSYMIILD